MNVTGRAIRWLLVAMWLAGIVALRSPAAVRACTGDCDGDATVTVDEILQVVAISLGELPLDTCPIADGNQDGVVAIDDVIAATLYAQLGGCADEPGGTRCGNGIVDRREDCDEGGICIGGRSAGSPCASDDACGRDQPGVCEAGAKLGTACRTDDDCPGSRCVRCKTFGGTGCAANCTYETSVTFPLAPGVVEGLDIRAGTSGIEIQSDVIRQVPLALSGTQTLTIGKERDGRIPVIIKAASVHFAKVPLGASACACVRALAAKTCGGTPFDEDGTLAGDCSDGVPQPVACPPDRPCTFVHGPGNSASGTIGCPDGLGGIDLTTTQDCAAGTGAPELAFDGAGAAGSAVLLNTVQVGTVTSACTRDWCTPGSPATLPGVATTQRYTTGRAHATALSDTGEFVCETAGVPFSCR